MTLHREPVEATPRGNVSPARRLRIWTAADGKCVCGTPVPLSWTVLDHEIQLWLGGPDDDAQMRPLCAPCDLTKTANDAKIRAKVKRLIARENGTRRKRKEIPSRPFGDQHRSMSHPTLKRTFGGKVVAREEVR